MKTLKKVEVTPLYFNGLISQFEPLKPNTIYVALDYNVAIHLCLCGCGLEVVTPFNTPNGWLLTRSDFKISMQPSIGNYQQPCKSHYIITNNVANFV